MASHVHPHIHMQCSNNTVYEGTLYGTDVVEVKRSRSPPGRLDRGSKITFHSSRLHLILLPVREKKSKQGEAGIHPDYTKEVYDEAEAFSTRVTNGNVLLASRGCWSVTVRRRQTPMFRKARSKWIPSDEQGRLTAAGLMGGRATAQQLQPD